MIHTLTSAEREMFDIMMNQWAHHLGANKKLSAHYNGTVHVKDLGVSIPPKIAKMLSNCALMWSKQAVDRIADCSIIEGWNFEGETPKGFLDVMERNEISDQYSETVPSELTLGPAFWTVTAGDTGEPDAVIASYDAEHATAIWGYRTRTTESGLAIVDVDAEEPHEPIAVNMYAPDGSILEMEKSKSSGRWLSRRLNNEMGRCAMEVMRYNPDKNHPFGRPALTPAILSHEDEANRQFVRMATASEFGAALQKWIMGVDEDYFDGHEWEAYMGSILVARNNDEANPPTTGTYPQTDMSPHINYIRQLANQFAAEASIPIHSLLYTEANPASAEAIEASRNDLVEKVNKLNLHNERSLRNVGLMVLSILEETPVDELGKVERSISVKWKNPLHPSLGASADAAAKLAGTVPEFAGTPTYWRMLGYDDAEIAVIMSELEANRHDTADVEEELSTDNAASGSDEWPKDENGRPIAPAPMA